MNGYLPAMLKENPSGWLIEYYVAHPQTGKLTRKKIKLTRIVSRYTRKSDARRHAAGMVALINERLAGGWNPFLEGEDARMYERLADVAGRFLASRARELRPATARSYESVVGLLVKWCEAHCPGIYCSVFGRGHAVRYMDYLYDERGVGAATYNNTLKVLRLFFSWMRERCYTRQNPFEQVRAKAARGKRRTLVPAATRREVARHLEASGRGGFLVVCRLVYNSLIRPNEIKQLRVGDVDLARHCVTVPGEVAKNHKTRVAALTPALVEALGAMRLDRYPPTHYLFGEDLRPSARPCGAHRLSKEWTRLRRELRLPQEMQLYSLRDTGIFDMLKAGIDDLSVMQHADHSSLDITTIYANHRDPKLVERIYGRAPEF